MFPETVLRRDLSFLKLSLLFRLLFPLFSSSSLFSIHFERIFTVWLLQNGYLINTNESVNICSIRMRVWLAMSTLWIKKTSFPHIPWARSRAFVINIEKSVLHAIGAFISERLISWTCAGSVCDLRLIRNGKSGELRVKIGDWNKF